VLVAASVALAALSLLMPSAPTYDPWAWIIWGREIVHLDLVTTYGPSWKPLPVFFTTLFAPFGEASPVLWLVVARAGAILALFLAYRVASRLAGPLAGVAAAVFVALGDEWFRNAHLANSEGLLVALVLWAIDRHLEGRRGQAFALLAAAALLRPEVWPFLGAYGLWLFWTDPRMRLAVAGTGAGVLALWFLPELWGSGDLFRASERANNPNPDSPAFADQPWLEVLRNAWDAPLAVVPFLFAAAVAIAVLGARRRRSGDLSLLGIAGFAVALLAIVALMTEAGYSGNNRYLVLPLALAAVVAGVAIGRLAALPARPALGAVAAVALCAIAAPSVWGGASKLPDQKVAFDYQADLYRDLGTAIERAGGRERILACGQPFTGNFQVPALAWRLELHIGQVGLRPHPPAVVFRSAHRGRASQTPRLNPESGRLRERARAGEWQVLEDCR
jgi:hypothetical protein